MPRPATIRIRVATMGCMPSLTTNNPFHSPHRAAATSAAVIATAMGKRVTSVSPPIIQAATVAAIASTAPTEISRPRTAITRVTPSETRISGAARLAISTRFPYRWPSRQCRERKAGLTKPLPSTSSVRVSSGQNSGCATKRRNRDTDAAGEEIWVMRRCLQSVRTPRLRRSLPEVRPPCAGRASPRSDQRCARAPPFPRR